MEFKAWHWRQLRSSPWTTCSVAEVQSVMMTFFSFTVLSLLAPLFFFFFNKARRRNISTCHDISLSRLSGIKIINRRRVDETYRKGTVCTCEPVSRRLQCRQSKRQQKQKLNKLCIRKSPALAAFIHLASNVFTFNSCWLSSSCPTSPRLLCGSLFPWHATTNSNGCRIGVAWHKCTFTPFQIHCSFTGTGLAPVLPTGNFHFSSWQSTVGKQGTLEPERRSTKIVTA